MDVFGFGLVYILRHSQELDTPHAAVTYPLNGDFEAIKVQNEAILLTFNVFSSSFWLISLHF